MNDTMLFIFVRSKRSYSLSLFNCLFHWTNTGIKLMLHCYRNLHNSQFKWKPVIVLSHDKAQTTSLLFQNCEWSFWKNYFHHKIIDNRQSCVLQLIFWFLLFTFLVAVVCKEDAKYTIKLNTQMLLFWGKVFVFLVVSCDIIIGNGYCFCLDSLTFCLCFAWLSLIAFCLVSHLSLVSHVNFFLPFDNIIHHGQKW